MKRHLPYAGLLVVPMIRHAANIEEPGLFNQQAADCLSAVEGGRWGTWKEGRV